MEMIGDAMKWLFSGRLVLLEVKGCAGMDESKEF